MKMVGTVGHGILNKVGNKKSNILNTFNSTGAQLFFFIVDVYIKEGLFFFILFSSSYTLLEQSNALGL